MLPIDARDLNEICEQTESLWKELRGQRIFITGGTGFFGCWLLESFAAANRRFGLNLSVTVLSRSPEAFRQRCPHLAENPAIRLVHGDILKPYTFPDGEFPYVIHAAADYQGTDDVRRIVSSISEGTMNTLEFAASHGTRKFLMVSTGAVYGEQPPLLDQIPEDYLPGAEPRLTRSVYGEAKRAAENLCGVYATNSFECKIARCFAFVGPHLPMDGKYAIGNFIQSALKSQPIRISGDGTPLRSYLYGTDLVAWLLTVLLKAPSLRPFNNGSDQPISIRDLAAEVKDSLGSNVEVEIMGTPKPWTPPAQYVPSVQRAYDELGLKQTVTLRAGIQRTAEWHGRNKNSE